MDLIKNGKVKKFLTVGGLVVVGIGTIAALTGGADVGTVAGVVTIAGEAVAAVFLLIKAFFQSEPTT